MASKGKTESRVEWLERRITRRSALKSGAAGTALAATALWVSPAVRTVSANHDPSHLGTKPPEICNVVWEDFGDSSPAHGTRISSLTNIPVVQTKRRKHNGTSWVHDTNWRDALIFNTESPTGGNWSGDQDLRTDSLSTGVNNNGVGGAPVGGAQLGNVLIIQENWSSGSPGTPDDNANGGKIYFQFSCPVRVDSIDVLDVETTEIGGQVCLLNTSDGGQASVPIVGLGNNSLKNIPIGVTNVETMVVKFKGSGAIAQICYCLPENCYPD